MVYELLLSLALVVIFSSIGAVQRDAARFFQSCCFGCVRRFPAAAGAGSQVHSPVPGSGSRSYEEAKHDDDAPRNAAASGLSGSDLPSSVKPVSDPLPSFTSASGSECLFVDGVEVTDADIEQSVGGEVAMVSQPIWGALLFSLFVTERFVDI